MAGLVVLQAQILVPRAQFERIQTEIPKENQRCLVHVTKYQAGQQCPVQKFKPYASPSINFFDNELPCSRGWSSKCKFSNFRSLQLTSVFCTWQSASAEACDGIEIES